MFHPNIQKNGGLAVTLHICTTSFCPQPSMDPLFPLVPIANLVACLLVLLSMSKNLFQTWNTGACSFAIWVALQSLTVAIRGIMWSNNVKNSAPVFCDISECPLFCSSNYCFWEVLRAVSHLDIASLVAIPASSFVIIRRLSITIRQSGPISPKGKVNKHAQ